MTSKLHRAAILFSVVTGVAGCGGEPAESGYEVIFSRAAEVGDRRTEVGSVEVELSQSMSMNGQLANADNHSARLRYEVDSEVLEVSVAGEATKIRWTIRSMSGTSNGEPVTPLQPGAEIVSTAVPGSDDDIQGLPRSIEPAIQSALQGIFGVGDPSNASDQEVFGPPGRVNPGDQWNLSPELIKAGFDDTEISLSDADVTGFAQLVEVKEIAGVQCQVVRAQIEAKNVGFGEVPPGVRVETSTLAFTASGTSPFDPALGDIEESISMSFDFKARANNGAEIMRLLTISQESAYTYPEI